jgi:hypothetical protein
MKTKIPEKFERIPGMPLRFVVVLLALSFCGTGAGHHHRLVGVLVAS